MKPKGSDEWLARCVFPENHERGDEHPSLVISEKDGRPLVHCRGKCDQKKVWNAVRNIVSGTPTEPAKELEATQEQVNRASARLENAEVLAWLKTRGISVEIAKVLQWGYVPDCIIEGEKVPAISIPNYRDGKLAGVKFRRIKSKGFTQANGSSIDGLYAAEVLDPMLDDVFVFEGEPDVALAMSHGFNATGILSANSKVFRRDVAALLKYKRIYLIGDQDLNGKKVMDELQQQLPAEKTIRVPLTGFKDIGELYAANSDQFAAALRIKIRMAQASREYFELEDLLTDAEGVAQMRDAIPEVVEKLIPANAITMFFGPEKSGKSMLGYYILKCIANGVEVFGVLDVVQGPVFYLDRENSDGDLANILGHFLRLGSQPVRYRNRKTGCPDVDSRGLVRFCEKYKPVLVFDSLTKFLKTQSNGKGADPFNPKEMSEVFDKLLDLCAAGATVIIIHHSTKADAEVYANSHQIGANVSRAYWVDSKDSPKLHRVRLEAKLSRGAEPTSFDLIGFPVIAERGMFGMADPSAYQTDAQAVTDWVAEKYPEGCSTKTIKEEMTGMNTVRINAAIKKAIKDKSLVQEGKKGSHNSRVFPHGSRGQNHESSEPHSFQGSEPSQNHEVDLYEKASVVR